MGCKEIIIIIALHDDGKENLIMIERGKKADSLSETGSIIIILCSRHGRMYFEINTNNTCGCCGTVE
jgi:hypothetical protein